MNLEVAMTADINGEARTHLLQHFDVGISQEDLCFALWRPSTGNTRRTAIIYKMLLPLDEERDLHGNVQFSASIPR